MALVYTASLPTNYLKDDATNAIVSVSPTQYAAAKQATSSGTTPSAPSPAPTPTAPVTTTPSGSSSAATQYGGMDATTVAKFQQAYGRTPNDTDVANWQYNPTTVNQQLDQVIASKGGTTGQPPTGTTTGATGATGATKWVNDLYQQYFDRDATPAEAANWATANPQQLQSFLINEQKVYGYTSKTQQAAKSDAQKKAEAIIDADPNLTPEMKALAKATLGAYSGGITADAPAIIAALDKIKSSTIDPHFADLVTATQGELKANVNYLQQQRQVELEKQQAAEKASVTGEQAALEKTGMTFTGEGVKQLGTQGAAVVPFGGENVEGLIPQANRLIATDTQQRYQENLREQMLSGEKSLGTAGIQGVGGLPAYTPLGGITGSIPTQKTEAVASALSSLASNQQLKSNLNTNLPNPT